MSWLSTTNIQIGFITLISSLFFLSSSNKILVNYNNIITSIVSFLSLTASTCLVITLNAQSDSNGPVNDNTNFTFNCWWVICEILFFLTLLSYITDYFVYVYKSFIIQNVKEYDSVQNLPENNKSKVLVPLIYISTISILVLIFLFMIILGTFGFPSS